MKLFVKKIEGLVLPKRSNDFAAGYDVFAATEPKIVADKENIIAAAPLDDKPTLYRKISYIEFDTNLSVTPANKKDFSPDLSWHIEAFPRSSISKYQLVIANGIPTIDVDYQGTIKIRFFYLFQPKDLVIYQNERGNHEIVGMVDLNSVYKKGDRICQIKPRKNIDINFEIVDELPQIEGRGAGAFGSSGK